VISSDRILDCFAAGGEEGVEIGARRHRCLCAAAGDRDGGCGAGESGCLEGRFAFEECDGEGAIEAVTGCDGVDVAM